MSPRLALPFCFAAARVAAQTVDFACVPAYRADPGYIKVAEASGGQVLLFQKGELGGTLAGKVLAHSGDPPVLRASGTLPAGVHEFPFPVEPGAAPLAVTAFAECVKLASILAPGGAQVEGELYKSGRIALVENPQPGEWRIRLAGTGYFTVSAHAGRGWLAAPRMTAPGRVEGRLPDHLSLAVLKVLSRDGQEMQTVSLPLDVPDFSVRIDPPTSPYRIAIEATDSQGYRARRMDPPLRQPLPAR